MPGSFSCLYLSAPKLMSIYFPDNERASGKGLGEYRWRSLAWLGAIHPDLQNFFYDMAEKNRNLGVPVRGRFI